MIKGILTILLLLISSVIFGQGFSYSYVDPCTKKLNTVTIPSGQSTVTVSYLGQSRTFTKTELEDGAFNSWLYTIQQSSSEPCGDFKKNTQTTQNTIITTNIISTLTSVTAVSTMTVASTIGEMSSQGAGNALSNSIDNSSENSSGDNKSSKKEKNGGNTNNPKNSNNGTSQEGGNNTSTNQPNQPSVGQSGSNPSSENTGNSGSNTGNSGGNTGSNTGQTGQNGGNTGNSGGNTGNTGENGGNTGGGGGNNGNSSGSGSNSGGSGGGNGTAEPKNDPTTTPKEDKSGGNGGTTNSVANAASASSGKSSGGSKVRVGSIIGTGDIVAIRSNEDNSNQFKATMSITKSNTDNSKAKGALLNFTTAINNSNLTFYGAFTNKNKSNTLIFANSSMVNFNYDLFNTTTVMESHRWGKLSLMGGANFTIGSLAEETFTNVSAVGGGFYLFKVGKNVTGNMLLLAVYSPFTKFYEGSWWESGTLLVPFSSWDYSISKTFKFNVSFSGTWEVNKSMLQYQILTGGKILL